LSLVCPGALLAQESANEPDSIYDRIWRFAEWYDNPSGRVLQRVLFSGRYQHDFALLRADQGDLDDLNLRRLRLGARAVVLRTLTVHGEIELNPEEHDPLYVRLTDLYLQWAASSRVALTVGKHSAPFTMDGATSSKELLAIDRSNLSNNMWFPQEYIPGVSVSGRAAPWTYRAGLYSSGSGDRELGQFDGGVFALVALGYDFGPALQVREALLSGNYIYQTEDVNNTFTRQLGQIGSLNLKLETDSWGVRADVTAASGYLNQSDLWGVMAMPFFNLTNRLQVVGRYTFLSSDDVNGVRLATYENEIVGGRGDKYRETYLGANYFFYGHKLKVQSGVQFARMTDRAGDGGAYSGTAWTTGIRVGWP
jgi:phosphate-selective porin OprO/OprP